MRLTALEHPSYDWRDDFNKSIEDCVNLTKRRGIEDARNRNETRAYYACGAVFGLVAESASGRSFFTLREEDHRCQPGRRHRDARRMAGGARRSVEEARPEPRHRADAGSRSARSRRRSSPRCSNAPAFRTASTRRACRACPDCAIAADPYTKLARRCTAVGSGCSWHEFRPQSRMANSRHAFALQILPVLRARQLHDARRPAARHQVEAAGAARGRDRADDLRPCSALRFAWERPDGMFFASVSVLLNIIALLGVAIAVRGCDALRGALPREDAVTKRPAAICSARVAAQGEAKRPLGLRAPPRSACRYASIWQCGGDGERQRRMATVAR